MNKAYIKQLFKTNKNILLTIFLFGFAICPLILGITDSFKHDQNFYSNYTAYYLYLIFIFILTYLLPAYNYRFLWSKKSVDTFLALPIKRKEMFNTLNLFNLIELLIPYIINLVICILILIFKGISFNFGHCLIFVLISIMLLACNMMFNSLICLKCNNFIDVN